VTEFDPTDRIINRSEINQPGLFVPFPEELSPQQQAILTKSRAQLGNAGLSSFPVERAGHPELASYDVEQEGSLGLAGYREVMDFLAPPGLETAGKYNEALWRKLRGTNTTIVRDERRWQAYIPLRASEEEIIEQEKQLEAAFREQGYDPTLYKQSSQLRQQRKRVISQIRRLGPQGT